MPITAERLYYLLDEHEKILYTLREFYIEFKQITRSNGPAELKLERLDALIETLKSPPDKFALIERANYNRNAKENLRQREKQRRKRRALGVEARPIKRLGSYTELLSYNGNGDAATFQLTPHEEAQLRQLQARNALPLTADSTDSADDADNAADNAVGDDRIRVCQAFFEKNIIVSRGEFTEFCATNGFSDSIDYFLNALAELKLVKRQEDGTYLLVKKIYDLEPDTFAETTQTTPGDEAAE